MTKEELIKSREKFILLQKDECDDVDFTEHWRKWDFFHVNNTPKVMGQYFLYEILLSDQYVKDKTYHQKLTYPKLGVYINSLPCDQTIELEWIDSRRTWEWNLEYDFTYEEKDYKSTIAELPTEIVRLPLWSDSMLVYNVWDKKPNWKELRQAYEQTWWFHRTKDELRDIKLNRLLNN